MVLAVLPSLSGLTGGLLMVAGVTEILAPRLSNGCYLNASYVWALIIILNIYHKEYYRVSVCYEESP